MMEPNEKKELAELIAKALSGVLEVQQDKHNDLAVVTAKKDVEQLQREMKSLWEWKKENEVVLTWAKTFMDTYRNTVRIIVASGAITIIGLLIQVYYTLNKLK